MKTKTKTEKAVVSVLTDTTPEELEKEVVRTNDLVERGERFIILEDQGEQQGEYGVFHSLLIAFDGEDPKIWNTNAWQVGALVKTGTPAVVKTLKWEHHGVKKTLAVETDILHKRIA